MVNYIPTYTLHKDAPQGTPLPNGRGILALTLAGLLLALASQLPMFR